MTMQEVKLSLGDRSYNIAIGAGAVSGLAGVVRGLPKCSKLIIITDRNVEKAGIADAVEKQLAHISLKLHRIVVDAGESSKSFAQLEALSEQVLALEPDRHTVLLALGGGVMGDLTGFLASILLRGVRFIQVPTTLLAMVDSSVGGKTGINTRQGKNLIGSFYQPVHVCADIAFLQSLPEREWRAGYAEVLKYALIHKPEFFTWLVKHERDILAKKPEVITQLVRESCESKAEIVAQDERESGIRALLNFGHTFGHALEAETGFSQLLIHGEGVAIGMAMAMRFSAKIGMMAAVDVDLAVAHMRALGLPTQLADVDFFWDADHLLAHMRHDKKAEAGKLVFILLRGIGDAVIEKNVDEQELHAFLESEIHSSGDEGEI